MRYKIAILILLLSVSLFSQQRGIGLRESGGQSLQSFYQESWAIVIGIDNYLKAPKLRYAVKDARGVAQVLVENYGFKKENVIELYDQRATKEGIMRAFDRIRQRADKEDRVFVFFAGHGITVQLPDGRERGYILPYDGSQSELIASAISTDQLNEISQLIRAKHLFFVMDACYGGLIFARAQPITAEAVEYVKVITTRKARKALTAGGRDQTVFDTGPGGHSVFTYYFIDALQNMSADLNKDGIITTYELNEYIAPRVTAETGRSQTPEYGILAGDMGGDFVFIPTKTSVLNVNATVKFKVKPEDAKVYVNDKYIGSGAEFRSEIEKGKVKFRVEREGYETIEMVYTLNQDEMEFNFELVPIVAIVKIETEPAEAIVIANGNKIGVTPVSFELKYGSYEIEVTKPGYKSQTMKVDVRRSEAIVRKIKLEETAETKAMRIYRSRLGLKNNLTYTGAGLTLVSAGVAVAFHIKSEDAYSKYQSAVEVEKMRMYKNDYKKFVTFRNISIGVGVVFGALTVYNALRKVSYEEIYQKVRENKLSFEMRDYDYVGFVPMLSLKLRI